MTIGWWHVATGRLLSCRDCTCEVTSPSVGAVMHTGNRTVGERKQEGAEEMEKGMCNDRGPKAAGTFWEPSYCPYPSFLLLLHHHLLSFPHILYIFTPFSTSLISSFTSPSPPSSFSVDNGKLRHYKLIYHFVVISELWSRSINLIVLRRRDRRKIDK